MIEFTVYGVPVAKARPRVTRYGTYTPQKTHDYEKLVKHCFNEQGQSMEFGLLKADIIFCMPIPKSWNKDKTQRAIAQLIKPTTKPDLDNLYKAVTDALNGLAYEDDSQIVDARIRKIYSLEPMAIVKIESI